MTTAPFVAILIVLATGSFLAWGTYAVIRAKSMRMEAGFGYVTACVIAAPVTALVPALVVYWLASLDPSAGPRPTLFGPPADASAVPAPVDGVAILAGLASLAVTFLSHGTIAIIVRYLARGADDRTAVAASLERMALAAAGAPAAPAINVTTNVQSPQHAPPPSPQPVQQETPKQFVESVSAPPPPSARLPQWVGEASRDGEYRTVAVEASSESEARRILESQGYFVHQLWPDVPQLPPPR
jgi:hypothetical protein